MEGSFYILSVKRGNSQIDTITISRKLLLQKRAERFLLLRAEKARRGDLAVDQLGLAGDRRPAVAVERREERALAVHADLGPPPLGAEHQTIGK